MDAFTDIFTESAFLTGQYFWECKNNESTENCFRIGVSVRVYYPFTDLNLKSRAIIEQEKGSWHTSHYHF